MKKTRHVREVQNICILQVQRPKHCFSHQECTVFKRWIKSLFLSMMSFNNMFLKAGQTLCWHFLIGLFAWPEPATFILTLCRPLTGHNMEVTLNKSMGPCFVQWGLQRRRMHPQQGWRKERQPALLCAVALWTQSKMAERCRQNGLSVPQRSPVWRHSLSLDCSFSHNM